MYDEHEHEEHESERAALAQRGAFDTAFYGENPDARRVPREQRTTHDIQNLWERQHEILNMALLGMKSNAIAKKLGISPVTVSLTLNSTLGKARLREMRFSRNGAYDEASKIIHEMLLPKALATYDEILDGVEVYPAGLRKQTADTVAKELAGLAAPQRIESLSVQVTSSELEELKRRGRAAARSMGLVVSSQVRDSGPEEQPVEVEEVSE